MKRAPQWNWNWNQNQSQRERWVKKKNIKTSTNIGIDQRRCFFLFFLRKMSDFFLVFFLRLIFVYLMFDFVGGVRASRNIQNYGHIHFVHLNVRARCRINCCLRCNEGILCTKWKERLRRKHKHYVHCISMRCTDLMRIITNIFQLTANDVSVVSVVFFRLSWIENEI